MKRLLTITATLSLSVLALAGCTPSVIGSEDAYITEVKLKDGRTIDCLLLSSRQGFDCDWESVR